MDNEGQKLRLTGPEISCLWTQYLNDSMSTCVLLHFLETVEDTNIQSVLKGALKLSQSHIEKIKSKLTEEGYPIPQGFTNEDVNLNAPRLFSDTYMVSYLYAMTLHGMNGYSLAVGSSVREDQMNYFIECSLETMELYKQTVNVMLEKGIFIRPPFLNPPKTIDFVKEQNYLAGWLNKRPLNGIEIGNIYYNNQKTIVKLVLEIAFSQVAASKELREYFQRGHKICSKHIKIFNEILSKDYLSSSSNLISEVTNSTGAPFSDKLMLFHIVSLISVTVGYYGSALSSCQRRDLMGQYIRIMGEIGLYAEDGANLLIKNGWMEQPPMAEDRDELARKR